jgi:hypothetical protein
VVDAEVGVMQSHYPPSFERDMGCTEAEWLGWLPAALGDQRWQREGAQVQVWWAEPGVEPVTETGRLTIRWRSEAPRTVALLRIPRLRVEFQFEGLDDAQRYRFMRRFDLYMQRGGG